MLMKEGPQASSVNTTDLFIEDAVGHFLSCHTQQMCEILQEGDTSSNITTSVELTRHCSGYENLLNLYKYQTKSYSNVHLLLKLAGVLSLMRSQTAIREELRALSRWICTDYAVRKCRRTQEITSLTVLTPVKCFKDESHKYLFSHHLLPCPVLL